MQEEIICKETGEIITIESKRILVKEVKITEHPNSLLVEIESPAEEIILEGEKM